MCKMFTGCFATYVRRLARGNLTGREYLHLTVIIIQNTNSVQFYEVLKIVKQYNNIFSVFEELHDNDEEKLFEICKKHAHLFILAQNQIINNYKNFPTAKAGETVRSDGYENNSPHEESCTETTRRADNSSAETTDEAQKKPRPPPKKIKNLLSTIRKNSRRL